MVKSSLRVVALEEEDADWPDADEDWESIYAEETQPILRRTYSEVLRGSGE